MKFFRFLIIIIGLFCANTLFAQMDSVYNIRIRKINTGLNNILRTYQFLLDEHLSDVDPELLADEAIRGMTNSLDRFTEYLDGKSVAPYNKLLSSSYVGIGISSIERDSQIIIDDVFDKSPAQKAGIRIGDRLYKIDNSFVNQDDNLAKLKGEIGTRVRITIIRGYRKLDTIDFTCVRQSIAEHSLAFYSLINDSIAYLQLRNFSNNSKDEVRHAYFELKNMAKNKLCGLILDLRDNGGGLMKAAFDLFELFVPFGTSFGKMENKYERSLEIYSKGQPIDTKIPMAIIVNDNTASASEFLTAALQDNNRAVVIGSNTVGKGISQVIRDLSDNKSLKITIEKYISPKGREINKINYQPYFEEDKSPNEDSLTVKNEAGAKVIAKKGIIPDIYIESKKTLPLLAELLHRDIFTNFANDYVYYNINQIPTESDKNLYNDFRYFAIDSFRDSNVISNKKLEELKKYYDNNTVSSKLDELKEIINNYYIYSFDKEKSEVEKILNYEIMLRHNNIRQREEYLLRDDDFLNAATKYFGIDKNKIRFSKQS